MFFQVAMFTVAGEYLTLRMRKLAFAAMLKQEMGWFDQPNNNTGALCSRLSADAAAIQGVRKITRFASVSGLSLFPFCLFFFRLRDLVLEPFYKASSPLSWQLELEFIMNGD